MQKYVLAILAIAGCGGMGNDPAAPTTSSPYDFSVTAQQNLEKGRAALLAEDPRTARAYFQFAIDRFPMSSLRHDAELGLIEADAIEYIAQGRDDIDTITNHCVFIAHHPSHPRVVDGTVACEINRIQGTPCVAGDRDAARYCGSTSRAVFP
jgi:hypothetical protein